MSTVIYGIPNCDTIKKAKKWLTERDIEFTFHDYRKDGVDSEFLQRAEAHLGWEVMLNKRGTTWRKLPDEVRDTISAQSAHQIMLDTPSIIKRPVVERGDGVSVGFNADDWSAWLS